MDLGSPRLKKLLITLVTILVVVLVITVYLINKEMGKKDEVQTKAPVKEKEAVDPEIIKSLTAPIPTESDTEIAEDPAEAVDPKVIESLTAPETSGDPAEAVNADIIKSLTAPK